MEDNSQQGGSASENIDSSSSNGDRVFIRPLFLYDPAGEFDDDFELDDGFDLDDDEDSFLPSSLLADLNKNGADFRVCPSEDDYAPESASWWDDDEIAMPDPEPLEDDDVAELRAENRLLAGVKVGLSGQMWFVPVGDFAIKRGDKVLIGLEQGPTLAEIISVISKKDDFGLKEPASVEQGLENAAPGKTSEEFSEESASDEPALGELTADELADDKPTVSSSDNAPSSSPQRCEESSFVPKLLSLASPTDISLDEENRRMRLSALTYCKECIKKRDLDMKLVDVEILHDRSKVIFYFTAPSRIDFRDLVKDLVRNYRTRIELRQIGVRNEAQMVGGVGNCGMVACCHQYLRKFAPVTIKMAKEQNLFLNPGKLSGMCGRLLCCLSFEQPNYEEFNRMIPKMGKKYKIESGIVKVLRANMFNMSVTVVDENNEEIEIPLDEWKAMQPKRAEQSGQSQPHAPQVNQSNQTHQPDHNSNDDFDKNNPNREGREDREGRGSQPKNGARPDRSNNRPRRKRPPKPRE